MKYAFLIPEIPLINELDDSTFKFSLEAVMESREIPLFPVSKIKFKVKHFYLEIIFFSKVYLFIILKK